MQSQTVSCRCPNERLYRDVVHNHRQSADDLGKLYVMSRRSHPAPTCTVQYFPSGVAAAAAVVPRGEDRRREGDTVPPLRSACPLQRADSMLSTCSRGIGNDKFQMSSISFSFFTKPKPIIGHGLGRLGPMLAIMLRITKAISANIGKTARRRRR